MPDLKFDSKVAAAAADALEAHVRPIYDQPGKRIMAIVELAHVQRTQPAPGSDKKASVQVRITGLEIPNEEQERHVREAQRALYLHRTATGTIEETGEIELSDRTLQLTAGQLHAVEAARLRTGLNEWRHYAQRVRHNPDLTAAELAKEIHLIADGLSSVLAAADADGDED